MGRDSQSVREEVRSPHIKVRKVKPGRVAGLHAFIGQHLSSLSDSLSTFMLAINETFRLE